jgi:hypothetical protein
MLTDTFLHLPIESIEYETLALTYPFRSNGPGDLCRTKTGVSCADCGQNLDIAPQSFIHEDP